MSSAKEFEKDSLWESSRLMIYVVFLALGAKRTLDVNRPSAMCAKKMSIKNFLEPEPNKKGTVY